MAVAIGGDGGESRRATPRGATRAAGRGLAEGAGVRRGSLLVVVAAVMGIVGGAAAPARADEPRGGSIVAIGSGPAPRITGALAARVGASGGGCRLRIGGWFGRVTAELVLSCAGVDTDDGHHDSLVLTGPSVGWLPIANPWFQLGVRGGLLAGTISGTRTAVAPCAGKDCAATPRDVDVDVHGFALALGATAQLALGARRGGRFTLWADLDAQLARFQFADAVVTGRITQLTIGIGYGHAF
jgi:hypothetical protein